MATKNLARTAIEPGRVNYSKGVCRETRLMTRRAGRRYIEKGLRDPDYWDSTVVYDRRYWEAKVQGDHLTPVKAWLNKHSGQPWAAVFSKLCTMFDSRNVAQRHVVYDHILHYIRGTGLVREGSPDFNYYYREMWIDEGGILRGKLRRR